VLGHVAVIDHQLPTDFANFLSMDDEICDVDAYARLQNDLVEYPWRFKGDAI
jgi:hypothetical protein